MSDFQFKKNERLKSSKRIAALFKQGQSLAQYPLRVVWMPVEKRPQDATVQMTVSVPKKKFPRAVQRNRLRRQVRECWRLHKHLALETAACKPQGVALMWIYTGSEPLPYADIEAAMKQLIRRMLRKWH